MGKIYDVDELAREFEPVRVRFRGKEYVLGGDIESLMRATRVASSVADDAPEEEQFKILPAVLRALCKDLGKEVRERPLGLAERLVFQKAVTEVMDRINAVPFRPVS